MAQEEARALRRRWRWTALALSGLALSLLFFRASGFSLRGAFSRPAILSAGCPDGCRVGSTLVFSVERASEPGFLAGVADCVEGRIWYFADSPKIAASEGMQTLPKGVRLDPRHTGFCVQRLWLLRRPLSLDALDAGPPRDDILGALEQTLYVEQ